LKCAELLRTVMIHTLNHTFQHVNRLERNPPEIWDIGKGTSDGTKKHHTEQRYSHISPIRSPSLAPRSWIWSGCR
jgi:hypothetical protein